MNEKMDLLKDYIHCELIKRNRKESDMEVQRAKMANTVYSFQSELDNIYNKMALTIQSLNCMRELFKIQATLNMQEEIDKQSIALYGYRNMDPKRDTDAPKFSSSVHGGGGFQDTSKEVVRLDNHCASCSG